MKQTKNEAVAAFARRGAAARLAELKAELELIYQTFPELRNPDAVTAAAMKPARIRRRPKWTPAMKKAARDRMKKYWASRRSASDR